MSGRRRSVLVAVVAPAAGLMAATAAAGPVSAAGTGGVELTPVAPTPGTAFHVTAGPHRPARLAFDLRNVGSVAADAHIYPAAASRNGTAYAVGGPGTARWIALPDQVVHLEPGATRHVEVGVDATRAPAGRLVYGAVVQEPVGDAAVRPRVATLVYLQRSGRSAPTRPLVWLVLAFLLVAGTSGAVASESRRHLRRRCS